MSHPLKLQNYFIDDVVYKTNEDGDVNPHVLQGGTIAVKNDDPNSYRAELIVITDDFIKTDLPKENQTKAKYSFTIKVNGFFTIDEKAFNTKEESEAFVYNGSLSILYGAAREFILNMTSRTIHGAFIIPPTTFKMPSKAESDSAPEN